VSVIQIWLISKGVQYPNTLNDSLPCRPMLRMQKQPTTRAYCRDVTPISPKYSLINTYDQLEELISNAGQVFRQHDLNSEWMVGYQTPTCSGHPIECFVFHRPLSRVGRSIISKQKKNKRTRETVDK